MTKDRSRVVINIFLEERRQEAFYCNGVRYERSRFTSDKSVSNKSVQIRVRVEAAAAASSSSSASERYDGFPERNEAFEIGELRTWGRRL